MRSSGNFFIKIFVVLVSFAAGFKATDWFFRREIIPYPFEFFGVLTGLTFASWTLAIFSFTTKRRNR